VRFRLPSWPSYGDAPVPRGERRRLAYSVFPCRSGRSSHGLRKHPRRYKEAVQREIAAYHRFVQLACIAWGLLQLPAFEKRATVWEHFRSWLRAMNPELPPSELVVVQVLRTTLEEFLADRRAPLIGRNS